MREKMTQLPHWCITDLQPAFYDTDSRTAVEQTGILYAKVKELIDIYNAFVDKVNEHIEEFEDGTNKSIEVFTIGMRQEFQDFIDIINLKVKDQDIIIADAVSYMKENIISTTNSVIADMYENDKFYMNVDYDEENEEISIQNHYRTEDVNFIKIDCETTTHRGVTYTPNGNTINVNGSATGGNSQIILNRRKLAVGDYLIGGTGNDNVLMRIWNEVANKEVYKDSAKGTFEVESADDVLQFQVYVLNGSTVENVTIKPYVYKVGEENE